MNYSQTEVEQLMYQGGVDRAVTMMQKAETTGQASNAPYAKEMMDHFVLPLAELISSEMNAKRAGKCQAHVMLLRELDTESVAALAVRTAMNTLMQTPAAGLRMLANHIGTTIHHELVLTAFEDQAPELYRVLTTDFQRRLSRNERHRITVFKIQAKERGIFIPDWQVGSRDQVGMWLCGQLEDIGFITIEEPIMSKGKQLDRRIILQDDVMQRIDQVKTFVAATMPKYGPCVEPPLDWTSTTNGGFRTKEMRRCHPCLIRHRLARKPIYRNANIPTVLSAVNALQRTGWRVNRRVIDTMLAAAQHFSVGEVTSQHPIPKPEKPMWLTTADTPSKEWPEEQQVEFKAWKRATAEWHTNTRLRTALYTRFYAITRSAEMYREYPAIYFVYFADSRGRLYPMTYGMNPQGTDAQKAVLEFAEGKPLVTPQAIRWFLIQGANKWGFDKATLDDRAGWHASRQEQLLAMADDPISNNGWKNADAPFQFLSWVFEYADFIRSPNTFVSHTPISMDGSCNGLQNLSAMLRDEIGGTATNLTPNKVMQDIYRKVAEAATVRMRAYTYDDPVKESIRKRWLTHGIQRKVVKRSVMTTPYGVTRRSAQDYVVSDYLATGAAPEFSKDEWADAASVLMEHAWPAIGDVIVKGRQALEWLHKAARAIIKKSDPEEPIITWTTPSGFPAAQAYYVAQEHRINSRLHGPVKIRVMSEKDEADITRHASGLAPNFVHSLDAAHLHRVSAKAASRGITSLAMIHDDYGTHAADSEELFKLIREEFVSMYQEHDPLEELRAKYPYMPFPPAKGSLDITGVLASDFFFS
jgi:DNA-directed RNA polymerase